METIKWISLAVGILALAATYIGAQPPPWAPFVAIVASGLAMVISAYTWWKNSRNTPAATQEAKNAPADCPHLVLAPQWGNVADMGQADKATGYRCMACAKPLTKDEAAARSKQ